MATITSSVVRVYSDSACTILVKSVNGTTAASQTVSITGLTPETTYYLKCFATDSNNLTGESAVQTFTTSAEQYSFIGTVTQSSTYNVLNCNITASCAGATFTACGIKLYEAPDFSGPFIIGSNTTAPANVFNGTVTVDEHKTYYYKYYATTSEYGTKEIVPSPNVITSHYAPPTITLGASSITDVDATYSITYSGNYPVTNLSLAIAASGGNWEHIQIQNMSGTQTGSISSAIGHDLTPNTTYTLEGNADYYSGEITEQYTFRTLSARPTVTIGTITNITPSSCDVGLLIT